MWMADLKHGELVDELPAYAPALKEVYRFILEALKGDDVAATRLFRRYLAGEMPEELLDIARCRETAEQGNRNKGKSGLSVQSIGRKTSAAGELSSPTIPVSVRNCNESLSSPRP
jgi:hypothetical protein